MKWKISFPTPLPNLGQQVLFCFAVSVDQEQTYRVTTLTEIEKTD